MENMMDADVGGRHLRLDYAAPGYATRMEEEVAADNVSAEKDT